MIHKTTWGLVLSGGGGKGAYQVGAVKALLEAGVRITAISGASVGALNAALLASYDSKSIIEIWQGINPEIAFSQDRLADLIRINAIPYLIERSKISCYVNGYNILTGKTDYFRLNDYKGEEIVQLLLASSALPFIYPPVSFQNGLYLDGGILDNTPIEILYERGYRDIIVINLDSDDKKEIYKDANVITFAPKEKWGFIEGTLNFNPDDIRKRIRNGYRETWKNIFKIK